jgi:hypothetical protein
MGQIMADVMSGLSHLTVGNRRYRSEDRLCGLVVRVPGCKPRGPEFDSWRYHIFCIALGLEWGPFSPVMINEELLEIKRRGSGLEN